MTFHNKVRNTLTLFSITHTTILFSIPEQDLVLHNALYDKCSMPKIAGCPNASGPILQYAWLLDTSSLTDDRICNDR